MPSTLSDLVRYGEDGERASLTGLPERMDVDEERLVAAEDFRWRSVDGMEVQGWLYRTRGEKLGTIVLVHGGPTSHAEDRFNAQIQYLASRGFDVLAPNYRGSTGFGLAFQESIKQDGWGGREQEDIRCGIEALIDAGLAEPGRVGVTGTSYGGYSAWWAITHFEPEIVAAAAPICGMTDLAIDYYATRPDLRPYSEEMMGGSPKDVPDRLPRKVPDQLRKEHQRRTPDRPGPEGPERNPGQRPRRYESPQSAEHPLRTPHLRRRRPRHRPSEEPARPLPAPRRLLPQSLRQTFLTETYRRSLKPAHS